MTDMGGLKKKMKKTLPLHDDWPDYHLQQLLLLLLDSGVKMPYLASVLESGYQYSWPSLLWP